MTKPFSPAGSAERYDEAEAVQATAIKGCRFLLLEDAGARPAQAIPAGAAASVGSVTHTGPRPIDEQPFVTPRHSLELRGLAEDSRAPITPGPVDVNELPFGDLQPC